MAGAWRRDVDPAADPLLAFLHHRKIQRGVWLEAAGQVGADDELVVEESDSVEIGESGTSEEAEEESSQPEVVPETESQPEPESTEIIPAEPTLEATPTVQAEE